MGMQVLKSPRGTEGWDGMEPGMRGGGKGEWNNLPPLTVHQLPSIPRGRRGPVEGHGDRREDGDHQKEEHTTGSSDWWIMIRGIFN